MGAIVISVTYLRGMRQDTRPYSGTGTDPDAVMKTLVKKAERKGWKIYDIEVVSSSFTKDLPTD